MSGLNSGLCVLIWDCRALKDLLSGHDQPSQLSTGVHPELSFHFKGKMLQMWKGGSRIIPSLQEEAFSSFQGTCLGTYSLQKEEGHIITLEYKGQKCKQQLW